MGALIAARARVHYDRSNDMTKTLLAIAAAAALVAGCDRNEPATSTPPSSASGSSQAQSNTPSTPANIPGKSKETEKTVPAQGQVDARQPAQQRDFEKKSN
jgi:uncharacterized lipoprotein YajG